MNTHLFQEQVDKRSFMDEIENCDLVEFDLDHVATTQFASLGE